MAANDADASRGTDRNRDDSYPIEGLAATLKRRTWGDAHELAREILELDREGYSHLVAIARGGTTAYLYHCDLESLVAVPIERDGLADGGPEIVSLRTDPQVRAWVADRRFAWLHPRYR